MMIRLMVQSRSWRWLWIFGLCIFLLSAGLSRPSLAAEALAASVERLQGAAIATTGALRRPLYEGAELYVGDQLSTGEGARLRLAFTDGATLTLGSLCTMTIEAVGDSEAGSQSVLEILRGAFLAVTRAAASTQEETLEIVTPVATVGVRGTTVWGQQDGAGLGVVMLDGHRVVVTSPSGVVMLDAAKAGTDVRPGQAPTAPKTWGAGRLRRSAAAVAFD